MTDLDPVYRALQEEYVAEAPARLAELRKDVAALRTGEAGAAESLATRFHRLAGSGGSYGFPAISRVAREAEQWIRARPSWTARGLARVEEAVTRLAAEFDAAARQLEGGTPETDPRPLDFGWRAHVVGPDGGPRASVAEQLTAAGFEVTADAGTPEELALGRRRPLSERPDIVVILDLGTGTGTGTGTGAGAGAGAGIDAIAVATAWSIPRATRPRGVVLIDAAAGCDRLRAAAAGVDMVFSLEESRASLSRYAKTLARTGTPPARVLLVEDDLEQAQHIASSLEGANITVRHATTGAQAEEALGEAALDLVLLDVSLPDADGFSLARLIRQDPRHQLLPVVFLTEGSAVASHLEALRAGADDFLPKPIEENHTLLLQVVITRAERGRRVREMAHRDGLTGLLNHATLMSELEHAVEYAQRNAETFAFLMIDIDHFKRVNDHHGHLAGDQALLHVARVFQNTVRGSDVIGRVGGDEFGMILRQGTCEGAETLSEKLRGAIAAHPPPLAAATHPLQISIGVACFPRHGGSATDIAAAADQALYEAKSTGRNRVAVAGAGA